MKRVDFENGYYFEHNYIAVSDEFLKKLNAIDSLTACLIFFCATSFKYTEVGNCNTVECYKRDFLRFMKLSDSYKDSSNLNKFLYREFTKAMNVLIDDEPILADVDLTQKGLIYVTYNEKLVKHFEGFSENCGRHYYKIWIDDLYDIAQSKHAWNWRKALMLHSDTREKSCKFVFSTKKIKEFLGLDKEAYMSGTFDRFNFEKECITAPLEMLAKSQQMTIWHDGEKLYTKKKDGKSQYDKVAGYSIEFKVRDGIKNSELEEEDTKWKI